MARVLQTERPSLPPAVLASRGKALLLPVPTVNWRATLLVVQISTNVTTMREVVTSPAPPASTLRAASNASANLASLLIPVATVPVYLSTVTGGSGFHLVCALPLVVVADSDLKESVTTHHLAMGDNLVWEKISSWNLVM